MNRIEDYYNCVRNSRLEWYLYRPEYLHLVAVVETVMILPTSSTIGSSYHFRNWIASHPSLHPSPRLQSRNEPISTTYRRLFILNQKVVFLLEAGIRDFGYRISYLNYVTTVSQSVRESNGEILTFFRPLALSIKDILFYALLLSYGVGSTGPS